MSQDRISWVRILISTIVMSLLTIAPLPDVINRGRPDWVLLLVLYWMLSASAMIGLGYAWLCGLIMDALVGTLLGQHMLAFTIVAAIALRFQLRVRIFPIPQQAAIVWLLLCLYHWILYLTSGFAGDTYSSAWRWLPTLSGALLWPVLVSIFDTINRMRR